jgi:hypothetical protein
MFLALAKLLDTRGGDRGAICRMRKLEAHSSSYEATLENGSSPGAAGDRDQNRFGAVFGMPGNQYRVLAQGYSPVTVVLRLNLQHGSGWNVCEEYSPFNL